MNNPFTERQKTIIINSFKLVFLKDDIAFLKNPSYKFLTQNTDFKNHLSLDGFRARYKDINTFASEIIDRNVIDNKHNQINEIFEEIKGLAQNYIIG